MSATPEKWSQTTDGCKIKQENQVFGLDTPMVSKLLNFLFNRKYKHEIKFSQEYFFQNFSWKSILRQKKNHKKQYRNLTFKKYLMSKNNFLSHFFKQEITH